MVRPHSYVKHVDTNILTDILAEVADNTWRAASSELNNTEDSFIKDGGVSVNQRKMNAVRAYFEWMPIR
jgi:phosphodiesterase/alkaline phosphatase D-like protein